jgi:hypothetical protein
MGIAALHPSYARAETSQRTPNTPPRSRSAFTPGVCKSCGPPQQRGRRECRMLAAPASLACKRNALCARKHHRAAEQPASPAQWCYGLYALSPVSGLDSHRRSRLVTRSLTSASGDQDHATSPSAAAAFVSHSNRGHRIPAPRIVTIGRNVPLHRGGMREKIAVICPTAQAKSCATDWHDGQVGGRIHASNQKPLHKR